MWGFSIFYFVCIWFTIYKEFSTIKISFKEPSFSVSLQQVHHAGLLTISRMLHVSANWCLLLINLGQQLFESLPHNSWGLCLESHSGWEWGEWSANQLVAADPELAEISVPTGPRCKFSQNLYENTELGFRIKINNLICTKLHCQLNFI